MLLESALGESAVTVAMMDSRKRRHVKAGILAGVLLPLLGLLAAILLVPRLESHFGPSHEYTVEPAPRFLTNDLAVSKAQETLRLDGYDLSAWRPLKDDRSKAPDGTPDEYLVRNAIDPNRGQIQFVDTRNRDRNPSRVVLMELKGDRLKCEVETPK